MSPRRRPPRKDNAAQNSTAISDVVVAAVSMHAAVRLFPGAGQFPGALMASCGFFIHGVAAVLGVIRFGHLVKSPQVNAAHEYVSWAGSTLAVPLIAATYYTQAGLLQIAYMFILVGAGVIVLCSRMRDDVKKQTGLAIGTLSILAILGVSIYRMNTFGMIGTVLYAMAGLVVGVDGSFKSINVPRVDVFHYILSIGSLALRIALE